MRILVIGDVTSPQGVEHLSRNLWKQREKWKIDFCVVNGENASFVTGISPQLADKLLLGGADCITGGNHTLHNRQAWEYLEESSAALIRALSFILTPWCISRRSLRPLNIETVSSTDG